MMELLMCKPDHYGVSYEINPWMSINQPVNHALAVSQWETLYQTILSTGTRVKLITPQPGWPDMVFTANAGLLYQGKIILSHFKYKERQGETSFFYSWFKDTGFEVVNGPSFALDSPFFEGAGDALLAGKKLFAGFGFRSQRRFFEASGFFQSKDIIYCELTNPYFYHLDTCFCPLNEELAIYYPHAFTSASQMTMQKHIELIPIPEDEAKWFACNAIVLDKHIILPTHSQHIADLLEKQGLTVHTCEMSEYLKAGGACKCITLQLD